MRRILKEEVQFNDSLGICLIQINSSRKWIGSHWISDVPVAHAVLTRVIKMVRGISDRDMGFPIKILEKFRHSILDTFKEQRQKRIPFVGAKTLIHPPRSSETGYRTWIVMRQPFMKSELHLKTEPLKIGDSIVWDERFIIRMLPGQEYLDSQHNARQFTVTPFDKIHYDNVVHQLKNIKSKSDTKQMYIRALGTYWGKMPPVGRSVIPCILEENGRVVSVPSLGINMDPGIVRVDTEYLLSRDADEVPLHVSESI